MIFACSSAAVRSSTRAIVGERACADPRASRRRCVRVAHTMKMKPSWASYARFASASSRERLLRRGGGAGLLAVRPRRVAARRHLASRRSADARRTPRGDRRRRATTTCARRSAAAPRRSSNGRARPSPSAHVVRAAAASEHAAAASRRQRVERGDPGIASCAQRAPRAQPRDAAARKTPQPQVRDVADAAQLASNTCRVCGCSGVREQHAPAVELGPRRPGACTPSTVHSAGALPLKCEVSTSSRSIVPRAGEPHDRPVVARRRAGAASPSRRPSTRDGPGLMRLLREPKNMSLHVSTTRAVLERREIDRAAGRAARPVAARPRRARAGARRRRRDRCRGARA